MTQPMPTPPGWYPSVTGMERWWDGYQWTEATRPVQAPRPYAVTPRYHGTVTKVPVRTSHTFHLLMTLLTCGFWALFVWIPMTIVNSMRREKHVTRNY